MKTRLLILVLVLICSAIGLFAWHQQAEKAEAQKEAQDVNAAIQQFKQTGKEEHNTNY